MYPLEADPPWEGSPRLVDTPIQPRNSSMDASSDKFSQPESDDAITDERNAASPVVPTRVDRRGRVIRLPARLLD